MLGLRIAVFCRCIAGVLQRVCKRLPRLSLIDWGLAEVKCYCMLGLCLACLLRCCSEHARGTPDCVQRTPRIIRASLTGGWQEGAASFRRLLWGLVKPAVPGTTRTTHHPSSGARRPPRAANTLPCSHTALLHPHVLCAVLPPRAGVQRACGLPLLQGARAAGGPAGESLGYVWSTCSHDQATLALHCFRGPRRR